tara:strand:+ start:1599 stop:2147 length:549 start_codon:yes stop_codon:yes gene_type:complete
MTFEQAWTIVKADSGMTSGTPGTNNPRHGPDSPGEPKNLRRRITDARKARKRRSMRPPGYGKDDILDPNRQKTPPKRAKQEGENPDIEALLEENRRMIGSQNNKSTSNLLYALGLFAKAKDPRLQPMPASLPRIGGIPEMYPRKPRNPPLEEIMGKLKENEEKAKKTASPYAEYYGSKADGE